MFHEAQLHKDNCFITLTYNDEHLPVNGSLDPNHLQTFFKRLRHHKGPYRYYACGEYGDITQRAHYHACLFGINFDDRVNFRKIGEHQLQLSQELTEIWGHGNTSIGSLTFETAAYTARYVTKKLSKGQNKYVRVVPDTGEIIPLVQPFARMSLNPAIGKEWLQRFHKDVYNKDGIVIRGKTVPPTRYYDSLYDKIDSEHLAVVKSKRAQNHDGLTTQELNAREIKTRAKTFQRKQV